MESGEGEVYLMVDTCGSYCYQTHYNWRWVVEEAFSQLSAENSNSSQLTVFRQQLQRNKLPSAAYDLPRSLIKQYSLLRLEHLDEKGALYALWFSSPVLEFLDAKDELYRALSSTASSSLTAPMMPATQLLPWDIADVGSVSMPSSPALLKAALGSGGNSLYFVDSPDQVSAIAKAHAEKANSTPGFVDSLMTSYGRIPSWSLQSIIKSKRTRGGHKFQIRAYVAARDEHLYLYPNFEVRVPSWAEDTSISQPVSEALDFDMKMADTCGARPYNHSRVKAKTGRFMLSEIEELRGIGLEAKVTDLIMKAMLRLQPLIEAQRSKGTFPEVGGLQLCQMAVAGIDVMLSEEEVPYIVELNNNPAMPGEDKRMSEDYRRHLVTFVQSLILHGLGGGRSNNNDSNFVKIW